MISDQTGKRILLIGSIDDAQAKYVCEEIIKTNDEAKYDYISLLINTDGGSIPSAFSIVDIMGWSALPVYTTGLGQVASAGLLILMAGDKRIITSTTSILSHQMFWNRGGKYNDLLATRVEEDMIHKRIIEHYIKHSKLIKKDVEKFLLCEKDVWLTPEEAISYGLVDKVVNTLKK